MRKHPVEFVLLLAVVVGVVAFIFWQMRGEEVESVPSDIEILETSLAEDRGTLDYPPAEAGKDKM